jgi:hypothetical protein
MGSGHGQRETHALRGPPDRPVLIAIRDLVDDREPLATAQLDDFLDPESLAVTFEDGLCDAERARIDVQWTTRNDYTFHYTDSNGVDFRWGKHPHGGDYRPDDGLEHYHPPPDASSDPNRVEKSCITQSSPQLVTRAVLKLWRTAYHAESLAPLNAGSNPP